MNFFLVEEYIEGIEFGAQAFVFDNQIQFILPHGDMMFYADTGVPIGHYVPYDMPKEIHDDVNVQLRKSIEAL